MTLARRVPEGELVDEPAGYIRVLALCSPFTLERRDFRVAEGGTLGDIVRGLGLPAWKSALVAIDGSPVPLEWWERVRPRADHLVTVRAIPRGQGDSETKGWVQILAGIVLIIAGIVLIETPFGVPMIMMGVGLAVSGIVTLVLPPPQLPKLKDRSGTDQPVFSITGSRNVANPWGVVPKVYGRHRIFPTFGALPYTEIVGNTQYLRELFVVGYGPLQLSELKIGDTPIEQFQEVEVEIRQGYPADPPMTLFPGSTFEEPLSVALGTEVVRVTHGEVDEWSIDFVFPNGLYHINGDGQIVPFTTTIRIWYREVGATEWILASDESYTAATLQPLRRAFRKVADARADYEIKVLQLNGFTTTGGLGAVQSAAVWAVLRSVVYEDPIALTGLCEVALRIKATDQLNGVVDQFNCLAESILPDYDVGTDSWVERPTQNPASVYRDILQGTANARPVGDDRLDLAALQAWHGECAAAGRTFSYIVEQPTTVAELLRQVVAVGRATLGSIDGTFGVVRDLVQSVPVQHFTPRNSRNFRGSKVFRDVPHAIKARFINPETGWEIDERFVLDDGYSLDLGDGLGPVDAFGNPAPTLPQATKFEAIQFFGVTSADQAWKEARYHLAAAKLRPEVYEFETDVEHIVCTRGDLIRLTHDVPLFGLTAGRVKGVTTDGGGNVTAVTVDEPVPLLEDGTHYSLRVRRSDGTSVVAEIVPVAGPQTSLTLLAPIPAASAVAAGDLFMAGVYGQESIAAVVTRIEMTRDMGARITCVDAAPAIHAADTGAIPPHDPRITQPPDLSSLDLTAPIIDAVLSDESVLVRALDGALDSRIVVFMHFRSGVALPAEFIEARYRPLGTSVDWIQLRAPVSGDATQVSIAPVQDGVTYELMLRSISPSRGTTSAWVTIPSHTVVGKTSPPPDVPVLLLAGRRLQWSYPTPPADLAGFIVRRHFGDQRTWGDAHELHDGVLTGTELPWDLQPLGVVTFMIKAVDVAGNESANAAVLVANLGDVPIENIVFAQDYQAAGFPGTVVQGAVVLGRLEAVASEDLFWTGTDEQPFWIGADVESFWGSDFAELAYIFNLLPAVDQVPADLGLAFDIQSGGLAIDYRLGGDALFWSGADSESFWGADDSELFWGESVAGDEGWLPWPGKIERATRQVYEFRIRTAPGQVQGVIYGLQAILDVPDLVEQFDDVAISASGTRLPILGTYREIRQVSLTLQDDGGPARGLKVMDKNPVSGPLINVFDNDGVVCDGLVDATVRGY